MTMHDSEEMLRAAAASVSGYLLKSDAEELLVVALRSLEEGQCFVSPAFNPDFAKQLFKQPVSSVVETSREEGGRFSSSGNIER